jgi:hypothetical protein
MSVQGKTPSGIPDISSKFKTVYTSAELVLRIPRVFRTVQLYDFERYSSIREFVLDLGIERPRIVRYDTSSLNALGAPYELQKRLKGKWLHQAYTQ